MDRSTIRTEAKRQCGEPVNGGRWTDANYDSSIERAQQDFVLRTLCLKTYATFTAVADTPEYDIGEDSLPNFIKPSEVWYFDSATSYRKLTGVNRDTLTMMQDEFRGTDAAPHAYCIEDRVIEFDTEAEAGKTFRVYYYKMPTALTGGSSVPEVPAKFHNALVNYVCWRFKEADDDLEAAIYFKALYEEDVALADNILEPWGEMYPHLIDDTGGVIRDV